MKKLLFSLLSLFVLCTSAFAASAFLGEQFELSVTTTAQSVSGSSSYLLIVNKGSDTVRAKIGSAPTGTEGIPIVAGGNWEPPAPPLEPVYLRADSGTQAVYVLRGK